MDSQSPSGRMRRLARRVAPSAWSLRLRLVVGVAVLAAAALTVMGTLGVTLLRSYLVSQVDAQLAAITNSVQLRPALGLPRGAPTVPPA